MCYLNIDTMHVDSATSKQHGKVYYRHLLRDSYREDGKVKHRTIANISHCSPEEIEAIRFALKHKKDIAGFININDISATQGMRIGAVFSLLKVAERIGLPGILGHHREGKLALWQVFARCLDQGSRLSAVRLAESHAACVVLGIDPFNEDHLYQNLAWLAEQQEAIEERLFWRFYGGTDPQLFLYDVTSSYLEGEANALAAFGHNRDGKKGKQQLVIGLLTGPDGRPIAIRVFEGNTPDTRTVAEQVRILGKSLGVKEVTVVGDRGMLKQTGIDLLGEESFHYITAITKPQIRKLLREGVFQMELFDETVCEVSHEGERYILRRNPVRAEEMSRNREEKLARLKKLVDEKNIYLAEHPGAKLEVAQRKVEERIAALKTTGWIKAVSHGRTLGLVIDEAVREEESTLDGCYVIRTDLSAEVATAETIHERYKDLARVERAFRTFKNGHLELRPIFVRNEETTRGHVFVVMLAYLLERELDRYWRGLEVTVPEGIDELGSIRGVELSIGEASCQKVPEPTGLSKALLDAADIRLPDVIPARKVHVATRKKLLPRRKSN